MLEIPFEIIIFWIVLFAFFPLLFDTFSFRSIQQSMCLENQFEWVGELSRWHSSFKQHFDTFFLLRFNITSFGVVYTAHTLSGQNLIEIGWMGKRTLKLRNKCGINFVVRGFSVWLHFLKSSRRSTQPYLTRLRSNTKPTLLFTK